MIQDKEVIMLILGICAFVLTLIYKAEIKRIYGWKNFISSFHILLAAWVFTVAEGFLWPLYLNLAEHICYMASALVMAIWCIRFFLTNKKIV